MKSGQKNFMLLIVPFLLLLLLYAPPALSASLFSGVYFGQYLGTSSGGIFAVLLRNDNSAIVLAYDQYNYQGLLETNILVDPDGSFDLSRMLPVPQLTVRFPRMEFRGATLVPPAEMAPFLGKGYQIQDYLPAPEDTIFMRRM